VSTPTQEAERYFNFATMWLNKIVMAGIEGKSAAGHPYDMAMGVTNVAYGLANLSIGLRATYMKLEEIERLLKQPKR